MTVPAVSVGDGAAAKSRLVPAAAPPKPQLAALLQMVAEPMVV
jgi:hypothetical protein